jgi:uncharacterized RDD family membrane protein YckC
MGDPQAMEQFAFNALQFGWLATVALSTLSVWLYYRGRDFPAAQKYETIYPRLAEGILDSLVYWPVGFLIALLSLKISPLAGASLSVLGYLIWLGYFVIMHRRYGQTLGKMMVKVRVVDYRTGGPLSWRQAWLREGIPILFSMLPALQDLLTARNFPAAPLNLQSMPDLSFSFAAVLPYGLSLGWLIAEIGCVLTTPKRRALHDFLAGTLVIRTNLALETPPPLPAATA